MTFVLRQFRSSFAFWLFGGLLALSAILLSTESSSPTQSAGNTLELSVTNPAACSAHLNPKNGRPMSYAYADPFARRSHVTPSVWICDYGETPSPSPLPLPNPCPVLLPALLLLLARPIPPRRPARDTPTILAGPPRSQERKYHYARLPQPCSNDTATAHAGDQNLDRVAIWPSRDPIGEEGGINLYGMVGNDAVNAWDYLGQRDCEAEYAENKRKSEAKLNAALAELDAATKKLLDWYDENAECCKEECADFFGYGWWSAGRVACEEACDAAAGLGKTAARAADLPIRIGIFDAYAVDMAANKLIYETCKKGW